MRVRSRAHFLPAATAMLMCAALLPLGSAPAVRITPTASDAQVDSAALPWEPGTEVISLRDRFGSTVRGTARSTYVSTVHSAAVNYQAADGSWRPIDLSLKAGPAGVAPAANAVKPVLSLAGEASDLLQLPLASSSSVGFGLAGALPVPGTLAGSSLTYRQILTGVDARFDMRPSGVKESLVLRTLAAPREFDFPLDLHGVTAHQSMDGSISFLDGLARPVARIPAGYMEDANVSPAFVIIQRINLGPCAALVSRPGLAC